MQRLEPNREVMAHLPEFRAAGIRRVLDAGCGVGRHLFPLVREGFQVMGVDYEGSVLDLLQAEVRRQCPGQAILLRADLQRLPLRAGAVDLGLSINVINHGDARTFREYCRELNRVVKKGGHLFIYLSPREAGELVRLPHTRELEPGTLVHIATPDGDLVHHFPTREALLAQFPDYEIRSLKTLWDPIPFMGGTRLPQMLFWARKLS